MKRVPKNRPLPKVNVEYATAGLTQMTPETMRSLICNPIYAGVGPFPALVDDEMWIHAAAQMIENEGSEQFLVNMLYVLRQAIGKTDSSSEG